MVQVTRVTEKLSYAILVKGQLSKLAAGNRLRRPVHPVSVQEAPPAGSATITNPNGSVTAPF